MLQKYQFDMKLIIKLRKDLGIEFSIENLN